MKGTEPVWLILLRGLHEDGPQTSMQLTERLEPYPGKSMTQQRNGANGRLRDMSRAGHAEVCGTVPSEYHNVPTFLWRITPEGERYLATWARRRTERQEAAQQRKDAKAGRDQARQALLRSLIRQATDNKWGPGTPTAQRREISRQLRAQGMAYSWIGVVFGVSHEQIRLDCNGFVRMHGEQFRAAPLVVPPEGAPGYVWARTRERSGTL
jgi:hypothetical protein